MAKENNIQNDYSGRINKVLNYIQNNIEKQFQLKELAEIGNFSQYHFHRIISTFINEPLYSYIKRKRLEKSAQLLRYSQKSITEISFNVGYETPSSFSSAFKKKFGISPTNYKKKHSKVSPIHSKIPEKTNFDFQPVIKTIPNKKVAFVRVFSNYEKEKIGKAWNKLFQFANENNLLNKQTELYGISYDNPEISDNKNYEYNACISIEKNIKPNGEIGIKEIKGGKFAVFAFKGEYSNFNLIYQLIFKEWLFKSKYELRNVELFDKYLNSLIDTEPSELLTEIYLPIK